MAPVMAVPGVNRDPITHYWPLHRVSGRTGWGAPGERSERHPGRRADRPGPGDRPAGLARAGRGPGAAGRKHPGGRILLALPVVRGRRSLPRPAPAGPLVVPALL